MREMRDFENLKIAVAGTGYVGLSIATLLAQHHDVVAVDVVKEKVDLINAKKSPIQDDYIENYLKEEDLRLSATLDGRSAYADADFVVIAAPTNYDPVKNYFDTSHVEEVIDLVLDVNPDAVMVIKSTIPVGYTRNLYVKYADKFAQTAALKGKKFNLLFSPEFLRESKALYDNLYPSRIIVGYPKRIEADGFEDENRAIEAVAHPDIESYAKTFARLLQEGALKEDVEVLFMGIKGFDHPDQRRVISAGKKRFIVIFTFIHIVDPNCLCIGHGVDQPMDLTHSQQSAHLLQYSRILCRCINGRTRILDRLQNKIHFPVSTDGFFFDCCDFANAMTAVNNHIIYMKHYTIPPL
jgi:hypothetical protein